MSDDSRLDKSRAESSGDVCIFVQLRGMMRRADAAGQLAAQMTRADLSLVDGLLFKRNLSTLKL